MTPSPRERSILITGASRGIGLALARALAGTMWIGMVARESERLRAAAAEVGGHAFPTDLSDRGGIDSLIAGVCEALEGPPEVLVNAAGIFSLAPMASADPDALGAMLRVNLEAPFRLIRGFLPGMLARGSGQLIQIGSLAGRSPLPGNAAYGASKYALRGMHEVLEVELRGTGVRTTLIEPAATDTALWDRIEREHVPDLPARAEMLRPEAVVGAILFVLEQPPEVEIPLLALRAAR